MLRLIVDYDHMRRDWRFHAKVWWLFLTHPRGWLALWWYCEFTMWQSIVCDQGAWDRWVCANWEEDVREQARRIAPALW